MNMPPIEKIHEALTALADGRVSIEDGCALVISSNKAKEYVVKFDGDEYASNDSGTYWQKYPGYPVIAVLMLQKRLPLPENILPYFAGIDWNGLNKKYKAKYAQAAADAMEKMRANGADIEMINRTITEIYEQLTLMELEIKRNTVRPRIL